MGYLDMVKDDIKNVIAEEEINLLEVEEWELYDDLWINDSVTGNASGSYTCNSYKAKEYVLNDIDTVLDALTEFGVDADEIGERFINGEWEWLDVVARCHCLGQALGEVMEELEPELEAAKAMEKTESDVEETA